MQRVEQRQPAGQSAQARFLGERWRQRIDQQAIWGDQVRTGPADEQGEFRQGMGRFDDPGKAEPMNRVDWIVKNNGQTRPV